MTMCKYDYPEGEARPRTCPLHGLSCPGPKSITCPDCIGNGWVGGQGGDLCERCSGRGVLTAPETDKLPYVEATGVPLTHPATAKVFEFDPALTTTFMYTNHEGKIAIRTVTPFYMAYTSHTHEWYPAQWVLKAWDHDRQAMRDFAFSHIVGSHFVMGEVFNKLDPKPEPEWRTCPYCGGAGYHPLNARMSPGKGHDPCAKCDGTGKVLV